MLAGQSTTAGVGIVQVAQAGQRRCRQGGGHELGQVEVIPDQPGGALLVVSEVELHDRDTERIGAPYGGGRRRTTLTGLIARCQRALRPEVQMLDCRFDDVVILDGSGRPGVAGRVGIRDGRVVAVGRCDEPARRVIHGDGAALAPGFVDIHVHYDAQVSWDPALSPSCLHGVTTVVGGNCGFSVAPMAPQHSRYIAQMLARVEGMPIAALVDGVAWDWTGFGEWLGRLDGKLGVNAGFFVGHSTVRRYVMGDAASERSATDGEIAAMVGEVDRRPGRWCSRPVDLSDRDPSRRAGSSGARRDSPTTASCWR